MPGAGRHGIIAVDMGGSFLKRGIVISGGGDRATLAATFVQARMHDEKEWTASDVLVSEISSAFEDAKRSGVTVTGIGICAPGPFDWRRGVSLMKHKLTTILGVDLAEEVRRRVHPAAGMPIRILPDIYAFAAGEKTLGPAQYYEKCMYLTLGTGVGSAFSEGLRIFLRHPDIKPSGSLWDAPYRDGTVEDFVSTRAIIARYREAGGTGSGAIDLDGILAAARAWDPAAARVIADYGRDLGAVVRRYGTIFSPQCIVIGGGLALSIPLFEREMRDAIGDLPGLQIVEASTLGAHGPLLGIEAVFEEGYHG